MNCVELHVFLWLFDAFGAIHFPQRPNRPSHRLDSALSGNRETGDEWSRVPAPKVVEVAASPEGLDDEAVRNWPSAQAKPDSQHVLLGWHAIGRNCKAPGDRFRERLTQRQF